MLGGARGLLRASEPVGEVGDGRVVRDHCVEAAHPPDPTPPVNAAVRGGIRGLSPAIPPETGILLPCLRSWLPND